MDFRSFHIIVKSSLEASSENVASDFVDQIRILVIDNAVGIAKLLRSYFAEDGTLGIKQKISNRISHIVTSYEKDVVLIFIILIIFVF